MYDLSSAMQNSITEDVNNVLTNIGEIALDSVVEDGLLKDIPIISTVINIYKIGTSLKERYYIKNWRNFLLL